MDPEFSKEIHFVKRFWPIAIMCVMYVCVYIYIYILFFMIYLIYWSKEVGKQYFRVTNDFYLMQLTMMKGGRSQNNNII